jgi:hypothetical protein
MDARHGHFDGSDAGDDGAGRSMSVAHDLPMALLVSEVSVVGDPPLDLGFDGLGQQLPGTLAKQLGERIIDGCGGLGWKSKRFSGSVCHSGVLPCVEGRAWLDTPKVRRLFHLVIHNIRSYLLQIHR